MVAVTAACAVGHGWLIHRRGVPLLSGAAVDDAFPVITVAMVLCAVVGALILDRSPRHPVGWLLAAQAGAGVGLIAGQVAAVGGLDPRLKDVMLLVGKVLGPPWALGCLALLFLLVPDGRPPPGGWRLVPWLVATAYTADLLVLLVIGPQRLTERFEALPRWLQIGYRAGQIAVALSLLPALAALVTRTRAAHGAQRRQLGWVLAGALALVAGTLTFVGYAAARPGLATGRVVADLAFHTGYLAVPACTGVAVLRHHLFDVDLVISRAVRLAVLTALVTAGYVLAVTLVTTGFGALLPRGWHGVGPSIVAFVMVVIGLHPLRRRLQSTADRLVYGDRAQSYRALTALTGRLARADPAHDLLPRLAAAVADACQAQVAVTLFLPSQARIRATAPDPAAKGVPTPPLTNLPTTAPGATWQIDHHGEPVGRLEVRLPSGELTRPQRRLLTELTDRAGQAFHNARLEAELAAQATALEADTEALAASRRRLLRAGYAERDRVSAAIRRDVVAHLHPVEQTLDEVGRLLPGEPGAAAAELDRARSGVETALDELRSLTRGVYPAVLDRRGLAAAVRAGAPRSSGSTELCTEGPVDDLPRALAATAYFSVLECLRDLTGPRRAVLVIDGSVLRIEISGSARPQTTTAGVLDRVEAAGGELSCIELLGQRRLVIRLPVRSPADPSARPRS
jgi:signal transduction histidine kinase